MTLSFTEIREKNRQKILTASKKLVELVVFPGPSYARANKQIHVIYSAPGMLLEYSGGYWPPSQWKNKTDEESEKLLKEFLLDETWEVTGWEDLSNDEIEQ